MLKAIPQMTEIAHEEGVYRLSGQNGALIYLDKAASIEVPMPKGSYAIKQINARTGEVKTLVKRQKVADKVALNGVEGIIWVEKL